MHMAPELKPVHADRFLLYLVVLLLFLESPICHPLSLQDPKSRSFAQCVFTRPFVFLSTVHTLQTYRSRFSYPLGVYPLLWDAFCLYSSLISRGHIDRFGNLEHSSVNITILEYPLRPLGVHAR